MSSSGRVWHFGEHSAWVIEVGGTPWLVKFPRKWEADRRIVRHILHRTPYWEPESEAVARLVRHLAGCEGVGKPTARELANLATDVWEMTQVLRAGETALATDPYFRGLQPVGWWREIEGIRKYVLDRRDLERVGAVECEEGRG